MRLRIARELYLDAASDTAFGHFARHYRPQIERAGALDLNPLVANYGPALLDRAILDALVPRAAAAVSRGVACQPVRHRGDAAVP